jgi:hypothetical protein
MHVKIKIAEKDRYIASAEVYPHRVVTLGIVRISQKIILHEETFQIITRWVLKIKNICRWLSDLLLSPRLEDCRLSNGSECRD